MYQILQLLKNEKLVNIKELQKSPSRYLSGITRILKGKKTLGFFFDKEALEDLIEDIEAFMSPAFRKRIRESKKRNVLIDWEVIRRQYGINESDI